MQETWVRSLGQKDRLEKEMATHSSILAWEIPWTEEPGGYVGKEITFSALYQADLMSLNLCGFSFRQVYIDFLTHSVVWL